MKLRWYTKALSSRRKVMRDVVARMAGGKLFHARGAATENARSPKVDLRTGGFVVD